MKPLNLKTLGMLVVMGLGAVAFAQSSQSAASQGQMNQGSTSQSQMQSEQKGKGSQAQGAMTQAGEKSMTGKVLGVSKEIVFIEGKEGEVIPLEVTELALVDGQPVTAANREQNLKRQIRPGDEVRTSFSRGQDKNGMPKNKASSIEKK